MAWLNKWCQPIEWDNIQLTLTPVHVAETYGDLNEYITTR